MVASWLFATTFVTSNVKDKFQQVILKTTRDATEVKTSDPRTGRRGSVTQLGCIAKDLPDNEKGK